MAKEEYILDGYLFDSQEEFLRAKKEKETIVYLTANTDNSDMKALLRIYNRSVDRGSFQTVIGQQYLHNIRQRLIGSQVVSEDMLAPIPVVPSLRTGAEPDQQLTKQVERYKKAYESALVNRKIKNLSIGVLIAIIIGMIVITATSRYSVLTYFTDYKENIREEVVNEMEEWSQELKQKEQELLRREQELEQREKLSHN